MKCTRPMRFQYGEFACGNCEACRISRAMHWTARLVHELMYWDKAVFATLTYADAPEEISKEELQRFFKRLRKNTGREIKYFACGEYGDLFGRAHYHAIILGINYDEQKILEESWTAGHVHCGTVTADSARYVAGYIQKSSKRTFLLTSQGFGKRYALENQKQLKKNLDVTLKSVHLGLPKYYKEKLNIPADPILSLKMKERALVRKMEVREGHADVIRAKGDPGMDKGRTIRDAVAGRVLSENKAREANIRARESIKRDKKLCYGGGWR